MRWAIFSDIHANKQAAEAVIKAYKSEGIDSYLCLGDIVGYGADPTECIRLVKHSCDIVLAGNHDWAAAGLFSSEYFNTWARQAVVWTQSKISPAEREFLASLRLVYNDHNLASVHGELTCPGRFDYITDCFQASNTFALMRQSICFIGHTHQAGIFVQDNQAGVYYQKETSVKLRPGLRYIVDVGSVGQPRDGNNKASFCIYDTERQEVLLKRVSYDIVSAQKKIVSCGLPHFLASRLFEGR